MSVPLSFISKQLQMFCSTITKKVGNKHTQTIIGHVSLINPGKYLKAMSIRCVPLRVRETDSEHLFLPALASGRKSGIHWAISFGLSWNNCFFLNPLLCLCVDFDGSILGRKLKVIWRKRRQQENSTLFRHQFFFFINMQVISIQDHWRFLQTDCSGSRRGEWCTANLSCSGGGRNWKCIGGSEQRKSLLPRAGRGRDDNWGVVRRVGKKRDAMWLENVSSSFSRIYFPGGLKSHLCRRGMIRINLTQYSSSCFKSLSHLWDLSSFLTLQLWFVVRHPTIEITNKKSEAITSSPLVIYQHWALFLFFAIGGQPEILDFLFSSD